MRRSLLVVVLVIAGCHRQQAVAPREPQRASAPIGPRLTPDVALSRISSSYLGGMRRCYEARLKRDASASGHVVVTFTVDESGKLASGEAHGVGKALEQCVERAMMRWSFPPPREEMTFRLAFRLSSRS